MYRQGDIVFIPYPFTDLSRTKQRPAIILSNDQSNRFRKDYIVAKVTSVIRNDAFSYQLLTDDLDRTMPKPSEVRTNQLFTVSDSIIKKRFATLKKDAFAKLIERVKGHLE
ncbi:MAG: type II toxin-antitoxin system PemK/MazF family toxin [Bacteroidota bacterium]